MRIAFRVDASRAIGTGHVRRVASLALAFEAIGAQIRVFHRDLGIDIAAMLPRGDWAVSLGSAAPGGDVAAASPSHADWAGVDQIGDAADTLNALEGFEPDWIVVDHYAFDRGWHDHVRSHSRARLCVIDDLADRPISADIVVDHNFHPDHRAKFAQVLDADVPLLGGPRFALLGPAFAAVEPLKVTAEVPSIGVFMGGVDAGCVSLGVLDAIAESGFEGDAEVVSTGVSPALPALEQRAAGSAALTLSRDLPDLAAFFGRHQLQIGAGGGATWERCRLGAPSILLSVADNQDIVIPGLAGEGAVLAVPGRHGAVDKEALIACIRTAVDDAGLRARLAEASLRLVDGRGAMRVALAMSARSLIVRSATGDDAGMMWEWRNHPEIRQTARNPDFIPRELHERWLEKMIADDYHRLLIGMIGQVPVGVIRFDRLDEQSCEVSLYLDPQLKGLGLGSALLAAGERAAFPLCDVHADVLEDNPGSARMFLNGGYKAIRPGGFVKRRRGKE